MRAGAMTHRRMAPCVAIVISLVLVALPSAADDWTLPGGWSPEGPGDPGDPMQPPCDTGPSDDCIGANASGKPGADNQEQCTGGEPVYLADGSFYHRHTDLIIRGRIPIVIRRTYDTRSTFNGAMGYGWAFNYHMRLFVLANTGGDLLLKRGDNTKTVFFNNADGTYSPAPGKYETIVSNPDGSYTLLRTSGYRYLFDIDGRLTQIIDRHDNQLLFTYDPGGVDGLLPILGVSPYSMIVTPILIGFDYRLTRIDEARDDVSTGRHVTLNYDDDGRVIQITDFTGRYVTYDYDATGTGDLLRYTDAAGNEYDYTYDANHRILTFTGGACAGCGLHVNYYDEQGRVIEQVHGSLVKQFDYLDPGVRTCVTTWIYDDGMEDPENPGQPLLLHTRYEYYDFDEEGRTVRLTRQMGQELDEEPGSQEQDDIVTTYAYYPTGPNTGRLQSEIDPRGVPTEYEYDDRGNLTQIQITDPEDANTWWRTTYEYDDVDNAPHQFTARTVQASFDPGNVYRTEYAYDVSGRMISESRILDATTSYTTVYTHNPNGTVQQREDPRGNVLAYEYDDQYGFLERVYDPADSNYQTFYTHDALGRLDSVTDALGRTTSYEYDSLNRLTLITNELNEQTVVFYMGLRITGLEQGRTAEEAGQVVEFQYDDIGRRTGVIAIDDAGEHVPAVTREFDSEGHVVRAFDGNDNVTRYTYDLRGRLHTRASSLDHVTEFTYDRSGNASAILDAEENETVFEYDFLDRAWLARRMLGTTPHEIVYEYNAVGGVTRVIDDNDHATEYHRDQLSRVTMVDGWPQDPVKNKTQYQYDGNDNIVAKMTPNEYAGQQRWIAYTPDSYNRLDQIDYPDGKVVQYDYDLVGSTVHWSDGVFSETRAFDPLHRLETRTTHYPGFSKTVSYTYDSLGRIRSMTDGEGRTTWYHRNAINRLRYITHPGHFVTEYQYDTGGRLTSRNLPNSVTSTFTYDDDDRITDVIHSGPQGLLQSFGYTYDDVNNRKSMTTLAGTHDYEYDDLYRLTSATHPQPELPNESYTYDGVQNRLTSAEHDTWQYDVTNFLEGYGNGGTLQVEFQRDAAGHTTHRTADSRTTSYDYDFDNHLVAVPEQNVAYGYSPSGRRLSKATDGGTRHFLYDLEDVIAEYDSAGLLQRTFLHGRGLDEPIAVVEGAGELLHGDLDHDGTVGLSDFQIVLDAMLGPNEMSLSGDLDGDADADVMDFALLQQQYGLTSPPPETRFHAAEALGSVTMLTDIEAVVLAEYQYSASGARSDDGANDLSPYAFAGRWYEKELGWYYLRARYMSPRAGRFLIVDPIGAWKDKSALGNAYCYAASNPTTHMDPSGHMVWIPIILYTPEAITALVCAAQAINGCLSTGFPTGMDPCETAGALVRPLVALGDLLITENAPVVMDNILHPEVLADAVHEYLEENLFTPMGEAADEVLDHVMDADEQMTEWVDDVLEDLNAGPSDSWPTWPDPRTPFIPMR